MLDYLKIVDRWSKGNFVDVKDWKDMRDVLVAWAAKMTSNMKQVGLDLQGTDYQFNNSGAKTQTTSIIDRLDALGAARGYLGVANLGLDLDTANILKLVSSSGLDLDIENKGYVVFNSTTDAGQVITRELEANISMTLDGCQWGYDTTGDHSDVVLYLVMIDDGTQAVLGITPFGGRTSVADTYCKTVAGNVTDFEHIFVSSAITGTCNITEMGWILADFDDTGGPVENYWTLQSDPGEVNIGRILPHYGEYYF